VWSHNCHPYVGHQCPSIRDVRKLKF